MIVENTEKFCFQKKYGSRLTRNEAKFSINSSTDTKINIRKFSVYDFLYNIDKLEIKKDKVLIHECVKYRIDKMISNNI